MDLAAGILEDLLKARAQLATVTRERDDLSLLYHEMRAVRCQCGDAEACRLASERDAATRERDEALALAARRETQALEFSARTLEVLEERDKTRRERDDAEREVERLRDDFAKLKTACEDMLHAFGDEYPGRLSAVRELLGDAT